MSALGTQTFLGGESAVFPLEAHPGFGASGFHYVPGCGSLSPRASMKSDSLSPCRRQCPSRSHRFPEPLSTPPSCAAGARYRCVYRFALTVFGWGGRPKWRNDIALTKRHANRVTGGERETEGERERERERDSCYSRGISEDPQQVWAGSEQAASRALQ